MEAPIDVEELKSRTGNKKRRAPETSLWESRGYCEEQVLVLEHMRSVSTKGSDVRMSTGLLFHPSGWPRVPVNTELWRWHTVMQFSWRESVHINSWSCEPTSQHYGGGSGVDKPSTRASSTSSTQQCR